MKPRTEELDENELNDILMTALNSIKKLSHEEEMVKILVHNAKVKKYFYFFIFLFSYS